MRTFIALLTFIINSIGTFVILKDYDKIYTIITIILIATINYINGLTYKKNEN